MLRAHLPESLACDLRWSSLTLHDRSFVDDHLRDSEFAQLFADSVRNNTPLSDVVRYLRSCVRLSTRP